MKALVAAQARGTAVAADIDGCETRLELAAWGFARPRRHFAKRIADEGAAAKFDTIWPSIPTRLTAATRTPLAIACERWVRAVLGMRSDFQTHLQTDDSATELIKIVAGDPTIILRGIRHPYAGTPQG